jgi:hypothetical protein
VTLNDDAVIYLGELANSLLGDPRFEALHQLFEQQIAHDLLTTKPEEKMKREAYYTTLQGARAFLDHLTGFAQDYVRATAVQPTEDAEDELIDDPSVHDF